MAVLALPKPLWERVVAHCLSCLPYEACGLLAGTEHPAASAENGAPGAGAEQVGTGGAGKGEHGAGREAVAAGPMATAYMSQVHDVFPATNAARSARLYTVEPRDLLKADREAERSGWSLIGVWHSHTHTPAYPSPTDVAQAPDPLWHYVLVSLSDAEPVLRSYRIVGEEVTEEPVLVVRP